MLIQSLTPKFKPTKERIYVDDTWISNGHWLLRKDAVHRFVQHGHKQYKPLMEMLCWKNGKYEEGAFVDEKIPNMAAIVPILDNYVELKPPTTARVNERGEVYCYDYEDTLKTFAVGIQPGYSPLCRTADTIKAKDAKSPVVLLSAGEVFGVIMPVRR